MKKKAKILWLTLLACNGNTHSFLNYPQIERFLEDFEFIYHPVIEGKYSLEQIINDEIECDILLLEGGYSDTLIKANIKAYELILKYAAKAKKIVTVGTCATFWRYIF